MELSRPDSFGPGGTVWRQSGIEQEANAAHHGSPMRWSWTYGSGGWVEQRRLGSTVDDRADTSALRTLHCCRNRTLSHAHAIWGSGAAVNTELAPSGESGERVRRTDWLTRTLTGRRSEATEGSRSGPIYTLEPEGRKKKVLGEGASLKLRTVSSCIYMFCK